MALADIELNKINGFLHFSHGFIPGFGDLVNNPSSQLKFTLAHDFGGAKQILCTLFYT